MQPKKGRWMLVAPVTLALILCIAKGIQEKIRSDALVEKTVANMKWRLNQTRKKFVFDVQGSECMNTLMEDIVKTPPTKDTICMTYQNMFACYPACFCHTSASFYQVVKNGAELSLQTLEVEKECKFQCGSGSVGVEEEDCESYGSGESGESGERGGDGTDPSSSSGGGDGGKTEAGAGTMNGTNGTSSDTSGGGGGGGGEVVKPPPITNERVLPPPFIALGPTWSWESVDAGCNGMYGKKYGRYGSGSKANTTSTTNITNTTISTTSSMMAVDVKLNWTVKNLGSWMENRSAVINPSLLFLPVEGGSKHRLVRAARIHRKIENDEFVENGEWRDRNITWVSDIVIASSPFTVEDDNDVDWSSWDPARWGLDGDTVPMIPFNLTSNRYKRVVNVETETSVVGNGSNATVVTTVTSSSERVETTGWAPLCISKPAKWKGTRTYTVVTGPEDPKLFLLPRPGDVAPLPGWGMLFSSLPPVEMKGGPTCHSSAFAVTQMYMAIGEGGEDGEGANVMESQQNAVAGVRIGCGKSWQHEKNWIPFERGGQQHWVYSMVPHVVLHGRPTDGVCLQRWSTNENKPMERLAKKMGARRLHGSATALQFGGGNSTSWVVNRTINNGTINGTWIERIAEPRYLALMHTRSKEGHYTTFAYMFDKNPPFAILAVSRPIPLRGAPKAFPSSLSILSDHRKIIVGYGVDDAQARVLVMSYESLRDLFVWANCTETDRTWWSSWMGDEDAPLSKHEEVDAVAREECLATHIDNTSSSSVTTTDPGLALSPSASTTGMNVSMNESSGKTGVDTPSSSNYWSPSSAGRLEQASSTPSPSIFVNLTECVRCDGSYLHRGLSYCPQRTTEVLYTCPKGYTPVRIGLVNVVLCMVLVVIGYLVISSCVVAVGWWKKRKDALSAASSEEAVAAAAMVATTMGGGQEAAGEGGGGGGGGGGEDAGAVTETRGVTLVAEEDGGVSATILSTWYVASPDEGGEPLGPFSFEEMSSKIMSSSSSGTTLRSKDWVCCAEGGTTGGEEPGWCEVQEVSIFPPSNAEEWYSLGDDSIMEGPYRRNDLKAWYGMGAVAEDLLISNGGEWVELHQIFAHENWDEEVVVVGGGAHDNGGGGVTADDDPNAMWYILYSGGSEELAEEDDIRMMMNSTNSGDPLGPYPGWMLQEWLAWGDLKPETLISKEGRVQSVWQMISVVFKDTVPISTGSGAGGCCSRCSCSLTKKKKKKKNTTSMASQQIEMTNYTNNPMPSDNQEDSSKKQKPHRRTASNKKKPHHPDRDKVRSVASFRNYMKQRRQSGAFSPPVSLLPVTEEAGEVGDVGEAEEKVAFGVEGSSVEFVDPFSAVSKHNHRRVVSANGEDIGPEIDSSWIQHLDESVDMHFYFRKDTGESRWDSPEEGYVPCEWTIITDPTSGAIYYFNVWSGESQWSKNVKDDVEESTDGGHGKERTSFRRLETSDGGRNYYQNEESGETVWTVPEGADVVDRE